MNDTSILFGISKVAYGTDGCTPFPMCIRSCAEYLGRPLSYTQAMAESGAAFRLTWDTSCWNGGNVDCIHTFDDPAKVYANGLRAMGCSFRMLSRTPQTTKEEFIRFIRTEIEAGNPVIALGIIGPPEACVIAGFRDGGSTLLGWNVFQDYPEHQGEVRFEPNGYFITEHWWENPDTCALFATGEPSAKPFSVKEILNNAIEALRGRTNGVNAKGLFAYDAWKSALLNDQEFPENAILPILVERMMCHGDAMDCLSDGRHHAALYMQELANIHPEKSELFCAAASEFSAVSTLIHRGMIFLLGGWERGEKQMRNLTKAENRLQFAQLIDRMRTHDARALQILELLASGF